MDTAEDGAICPEEPQGLQAQRGQVGRRWGENGAETGDQPTGWSGNDKWSPHNPSPNPGMTIKARHYLLIQQQKQDF